MPDVAEIRRRAVEFEAVTWRYGNVVSAGRSFDRLVVWARGLDAAGRRSHAAGAWYANDPLKLGAVNVVQVERGERSGWCEEADV